MSAEVSGSSPAGEIEVEKRAYKISKAQQRAVKCTEKSHMNSVNNEHELMLVIFLSLQLHYSYHHKCLLPGVASLYVSKSYLESS